MMGTRGIRATALLAASLALLTACSSDGSAAGGSRRDGSGPSIREYEPGTGGTLGQADTEANTPYAFDDATLCLTSPGSVTVENVEIVKPTGGIRLRMFSVRPGRTGQAMNYIADPRQRLTAVGYRTQGPWVVDRVCPELSKTEPPGPGFGVTLLGVELVKPADATATGSGFVVTYRSGKKRSSSYRSRPPSPAQSIGPSATAPPGRSCSTPAAPAWTATPPPAGCATSPRQPA